jgi:hypothetical protein
LEPATTTPVDGTLRSGKAAVVNAAIPWSNPDTLANPSAVISDTWVTVYTGNRDNTFGPKGFRIGSSAGY